MCGTSSEGAAARFVEMGVAVQEMLLVCSSCCWFAASAAPDVVWVQVCCRETGQTFLCVFPVEKRGSYA